MQQLVQTQTQDVPIENRKPLHTPANGITVDQFVEIYYMIYNPAQCLLYVVSLIVRLKLGDHLHKWSIDKLSPVEDVEDKLTRFTSLHQGRNRRI